MSQVGKQIVEGLKDAVDFTEGRTGALRVHKVSVPEQVDVRKIRESLGMSQRAFAQAFGFSVHSIRNWEQGKRQPEGPARALLTVIDKEPQAVVRSLAD